MEIPKGLVDEINAGECVAFVGAGFSGVVVPPWASYEFEWQGLFREVERIFTSGSQYA